MTPTDLLHLAVREFPECREFVYCEPRSPRPVPLYLEPGDRWDLAGFPAVIEEWSTDTRGRRLLAELRAWVPRTALRRNGLQNILSPTSVQPVPPPELRDRVYQPLARRMTS
jgi:hypothetical protein